MSTAMHGNLVELGLQGSVLNSTDVSDNINNNLNVYAEVSRRRRRYRTSLETILECDLQHPEGESSTSFSSVNDSFYGGSSLSFLSNDSLPGVRTRPSRTFQENKYSSILLEYDLNGMRSTPPERIKLDRYTGVEMLYCTAKWANDEEDDAQNQTKMTETSKNLRKGQSETYDKMSKEIHSLPHDSFYPSPDLNISSSNAKLNSSEKNVKKELNLPEEHKKEAPMESVKMKVVPGGGTATTKPDDYIIDSQYFPPCQLPDARELTSVEEEKQTSREDGILIQEKPSIVDIIKQHKSSSSVNNYEEDEDEEEEDEEDSETMKENIYKGDVTSNKKSEESSSEEQKRNELYSKISESKSSLYVFPGDEESNSLDGVKSDHIKISKCTEKETKTWCTRENAPNYERDGRETKSSKTLSETDTPTSSSYRHVGNTVKSKVTEKGDMLIQKKREIQSKHISSDIFPVSASTMMKLNVPEYNNQNLNLNNFKSVIDKSANLYPSLDKCPFETLSAEKLTDVINMVNDTISQLKGISDVNLNSILRLPFNNRLDQNYTDSHIKYDYGNVNIDNYNIWSKPLHVKNTSLGKMGMQPSKESLSTSNSSYDDKWGQNKGLPRSSLNFMDTIGAIPSSNYGKTGTLEQHQVVNMLTNLYTFGPMPSVSTPLESTTSGAHTCKVSTSAGSSSPNNTSPLLDVSNDIGDFVPSSKMLPRSEVKVRSRLKSQKSRSNSGKDPIIKANDLLDSSITNQVSSSTVNSSIPVLTKETKQLKERLTQLKGSITDSKQYIQKCLEEERDRNRKDTSNKSKTNNNDKLSFDSRPDVNTYLDVDITSGIGAQIAALSRSVDASKSALMGVSEGGKCTGINKGNKNRRKIPSNIAKVKVCSSSNETLDDIDVVMAKENTFTRTQVDLESNNTREKVISSENSRQKKVKYSRKVTDFTSLSTENTGTQPDSKHIDDSSINNVVTLETNNDTLMDNNRKKRDSVHYHVSSECEKKQNSNDHFLKSPSHPANIQTSNDSKQNPTAKREEKLKSTCQTNHKSVAPKEEIGDKSVTSRESKGTSESVEDKESVKLEANTSAFSCSLTSCGEGSRMDRSISSESYNLSTKTEKKTKSSLKKKDKRQQHKSESAQKKNHVGAPSEQKGSSRSCTSISSGHKTSSRPSKQRCRTPSNVKNKYIKPTEDVAALTSLGGNRVMTYSEIMEWLEKSISHLELEGKLQGDGKNERNSRKKSHGNLRKKQKVGERTGSAGRKQRNKNKYKGKTNEIRCSSSPKKERGTTQDESLKSNSDNVLEDSLENESDIPLQDFLRDRKDIPLEDSSKEKSGITLNGSLKERSEFTLSDSLKDKSDFTLSDSLKQKSDFTLSDSLKEKSGVTLDASVKDDSLKDDYIVMKQTSQSGSLDSELQQEQEQENRTSNGSIDSLMENLILSSSNTTEEVKSKESANEIEGNVNEVDAKISNAILRALFSRDKSRLIKIDNSKDNHRPSKKSHKNDSISLLKEESPRQSEDIIHRKKEPKSYLSNSSSSCSTLCKTVNPEIPWKNDQGKWTNDQETSMISDTNGTASNVLTISSIVTSVIETIDDSIYHCEKTSDNRNTFISRNTQTGFLPEAYSKYVTKTNERIPKRETRNSERPFIADSRKVDAVLDMISDVYENENKLFENRSVNSYVTCEREVYRSGTRTDIQRGTNHLHPLRTKSAGYRFRPDCRTNQEYLTRGGNVRRGYSSDNYVKRNVCSLQTNSSPCTRQGRCNTFTSGRSRSYGCWSSDIDRAVGTFSQSQTNLTRSQQPSELQSSRTASRWYLSNMSKEATTSATMPFSPATKGRESRERTPPDEFCCSMDQVEDLITTTVTTISSDSISDGDEYNDWTSWVMAETDINTALPEPEQKKEKKAPSKETKSSVNNNNNNNNNRKEPSDSLKYKTYAKKSLRSYQYVSSSKSIRSSNPPVSRSVELGGVVFMGVGGESMSTKGIRCSSYVSTQMRPVRSPPVRERNEKKYIRTRKVQTEECFHSRKRKPVKVNEKRKSKAEPDLIVKNSNRQSSSLVPKKDAEVASKPRSVSPSRKDACDERKEKALTLEIEKTDHWNTSKSVTVTRLEIMESNILTSLSRNLTDNSQEKKPLPGNKAIPNKQIQKRPSLNVNRRLNTYRCEKRSARLEALLSVLFKSISRNEGHRKPKITGIRSAPTAGRTVKSRRTSKRRALRRGERKTQSVSMCGIGERSDSRRLPRIADKSRSEETNYEEEHLKRNSPIVLGEPYDYSDPNGVPKQLDGQISSRSYPPLVINHNWDKSITESRAKPLNEQVMEHRSHCDRNFIKPMNSFLSTPQETFSDSEPVALTQEVKGNEYEEEASKLMICKSVQTIEVEEGVERVDMSDSKYVSKEVQTSIDDSEEIRDDESTCNDKGVPFFSGTITVERFAQGFKEQLQRLMSLRNNYDSSEAQHILGVDSTSNVQNLSKSLVEKLKTLFSETSIVKSECGSESELSLRLLDDSDDDADDLGDAGDRIPPLTDIHRNRSSMGSVNNLATIVSSSLLSVEESNSKVIPITDDKSKVVIDLNSRANVDKFHIDTRNMVNSKEADNFIEVKSSRSVTEIRIGVASLEQGTNSSNIVKLEINNSSNAVTISVEPREIFADSVSIASDEGTVIIDLSLENSRIVGTAIVFHCFVLRRAFEVDLAQEEYLIEYLETGGLSNEEDNLACEYECSLWCGHPLRSMGDITGEFETAVNEVASEDEITVHDLVSPGSLKCILSVLSHANSSREYSLLSPEAFEGEILNDSPKPDSMHDVMDAYSLLSSNSSLMNDIYSSDIISTPSYISDSMESAQGERLRNILQVMGREVTYGVSEIEIQVYTIKFPLVLSIVYLFYISCEWNQISIEEVVEKISSHEEGPIYPAESSVEQDLDGAGDGTSSPLHTQTDNKHDFWASLNLEDLMRAGPAYHLQDRRDSSSLSVMVTQSVGNQDNISVSETGSGSASGSGSGSGSDFDCDYETLYNHLLAAYARKGETDTDTTYSTIDTDTSREGISKLLAADETPETRLHQAYSQILADVVQDQICTENSTHRVFISAEGEIVSEVITQCLDLPVNNYPHFIHSNDSSSSLENTTDRYKSETSPRKRMIICLLCTLLFLVVFCALCLPDILYYDEDANDNISLEEFIYDFSSDDFML